MEPIIEPKIYTLDNQEEILLRKASSSDVAKIIDFMRSIFETGEYLATTSEEFKPDPIREEQSLKISSQSKTDLILLALINDQIVGLTDFSNRSIKRRAHCGSLDIFVDKNFRGRGIGKILLSSLINWASRVQSLERVELSVFANNTAAISLYKSLGFFEEGRKLKSIRYGHDSYVDELLMARFL